MSQDHVDLDAQTVSNGLAKWEQAAATLQSRWTALNGQITGLLTDRTYGADEPGSKFRQSFVEEGQAAGLAARGKVTVDRVVEAGQNIRKCAEDSLAADQEQASEVGVDVPSFNSGGGGASSGGGGASSGGGGASSGGGGSSSGGSSAGEGEMGTSDVVLEDAQLGGPADQDISYERQPIGDAQSPYLPPGDETQVVAGSGGGAQSSTDGTTSEMGYDAAEAGTGGTAGGAQSISGSGPAAGEGRPAAVSDAGGGRDPATVGADRMTTQPVADGGSVQPTPETGPGERGQAAGPALQNPGGPADTIRERIAERIPDSVIERLPDGMAERIYEARADYDIEVPGVDVGGVDVPQHLDMQGVDNSTEGVQVSGAPGEKLPDGGDELTVQQPR